MNDAATRTAIVIAGALIALASSAKADAQAETHHRTPRSWNYDMDRLGNRVPKDSRVIRPDGSWREEIRQGNCLTVKQRAATGEYRETRQCTPSPTG